MRGDVEGIVKMGRSVGLMVVVTPSLLWHRFGEKLGTHWANDAGMLLTTNGTDQVHDGAEGRW